MKKFIGAGVLLALVVNVEAKPTSASSTAVANAASNSAVVGGQSQGQGGSANSNNNANNASSSAQSNAATGSAVNPASSSPPAVLPPAPALPLEGIDPMTSPIAATIIGTDPESILSVNPEPEVTAFATTSVSEVPSPAAVWLFGSALAGLVGLKKRK